MFLYIVPGKKKKKKKKNLKNKKRRWALARARIYISVAKPYGRFGQKLESLQAGQGRTGQGKTGQGRGTDQKRAEQK